MRKSEFTELPIYTVVDTDNWLMVKTDDDEWTPVGWETFTASDEEMATMTYHLRDDLYFAYPKIVAVGVTNV